MSGRISLSPEQMATRISEARCVEQDFLGGNQYLAKLQQDNESWYAVANNWNEDLGKYHLEILDWRNVSVSTIEGHH